MDRLCSHLQAVQARQEGALVLFVTAGDQPLDQLPELLKALEAGGADAIEIGIPFSDPIADGPTIQASSQRSLERGTTPQSVLQALRSCASEVPARLPIVLMGYVNTVLRVGYAEFAEQAQSAGVAGTILSDLTPEEAGDWVEESRKRDLANVFLVAPTSTDERIQAACRNASGFVYAVSRTGVTGVGQQGGSNVGETVGRIRAFTQLPICVGFGISRPEDVRAACQSADGAVVGSWLVDFLHQRWQDGRGAQEVIEAVRALKSATRSRPTSDR